METIKQFKIQQIKIVEILQRLLSFINEGKKFGINTDFDLINKISKGIAEVKTQKLKVALVGGFSEGKTSIVAAWSGNYDSETMKIDSSESSDEVQIYHLDEFELIDTPGLFGFKETSNQVKYKEITRKYVSEANLFTDLILQVKGTDIETINEFFERNIGDEGIVLETTIQNEFERQLGKIAYEISKAETNFNASINHYNNMVGDLAIQGMKISKEFLKNAKVSSKAILTTRDFLMPTFKFKPSGSN